MSENVIHISTYKMIKHLNATDFVPYKNKYYFMSPAERAEERVKVAAILFNNPHNAYGQLMRRAHEETDNE